MATRKPKRSPKRPRAATADVLGGRPAAQRIPAKWQPHYRRLVALREELRLREAELAKDAREEQPAFSSHMADAGTDTFDRDFALGLLSSEQDAVYEIEQALDRIRNGAYGVCELTGRPIERARLEAIPWTRFTAAAERQLEKKGEVKAPRLGPRQSLPRTEAGGSPEKAE